MDDPKSSRKRKRVSDSSVDLTGTKFGQLRQVVHDLRPYILEVLRSPDLQNNRSSPIVRQGIRQVKELCKQLRNETMLLAKQKKVSEPGKENAEEALSKKQVKTDAETLISVDDPGPSLLGTSPPGWNFVVVRNLPGQGIA